MIAKGTGVPIAVIPGIQGRWEWMAPTIDALTVGHRVVAFSLTELRPDRSDDGTFLEWMRAVDRALDQAHERRAALIGVSFGGLIAACYAARRPERVSALILVSAPPPIWKPRPGDAFCARFPRLAFPYFAVRAMRRLVPEIYHARDSWAERARFAAEYARRSLTAPFSPVYAAQWVREWQAYDMSPDCARIMAPTLVVTGESHLERVVPTDRTLEYLRLIPGARHAVLQGTGHIGLIAKPQRFADIAGAFIDAANSAEPNPRPIESPVARYAS